MHSVQKEGGAVPLQCSEQIWTAMIVQDATFSKGILMSACPKMNKMVRGPQTDFKSVRKGWEDSGC